MQLLLQYRHLAVAAALILSVCIVRSFSGAFAIPTSENLTPPSTSSSPGGAGTAQDDQPHNSQHHDLFENVQSLPDLESLKTEISALLKSSNATCLESFHDFDSETDQQVKFLQPFSNLPPNSNQIGSPKGQNNCRSKYLTFRESGIYTCSAYLTPKDEFQSSAWSHLILFPHDPSLPLHDISYHAVARGPAFVAPITTPLVVRNTQIYLLSFRFLHPGSYTLAVNQRYYLDNRFHYTGTGSGNDPHAYFLGESEGRQCDKGSPHNWCLHSAGLFGTKLNGLHERGCQGYTSVLYDSLTVSDPPLSTAPPPFLDLPLLTSMERSPDGYWLKVGDTSDDCRSRDHSSYLTGNPCVLEDPRPGVANRPVYVWMASDSRMHYYTSEEIGDCFAERGIKSLVLCGDSLARNSIFALASLIGHFNGTDDYTERLKEMQHQFKASNGKLFSEDIIGLGPRGIDLHFVSVWNEGAEDFTNMFDDMGVSHPGGPNLLIGNYGTPGHKINTGMDYQDMSKHWENLMAKDPPKYRVLLGGPTLQGVRQLGWTNSLIKVNNVKNRELGKSVLSMAWLDMEQMTAALPIDQYASQDGYHPETQYLSTVYMALFNSICNSPPDQDEAEWYKNNDKNLAVPSWASFTEKDMTMIEESGTHTSIYNTIDDTFRLFK